MDEMSMIRRLLTEPPPLPHVVAEGRERVFGPSTQGTHATRAPRTARRVVLRNAFLVGLTGAAAAAALVVAASVPTPGTSHRGNPPSTERMGQNALLAAAVSAESVPTGGEYWHVRSLSSTTLSQRFGRSDDRYSLEHLLVSEEWTTHGGRTWLGQREWVRPETQDDAAAWRRDGSPSKWCDGETDTEPSESICFHTEPGTASLTRVGVDAFVVTEGRELTYGQLQRLPEDPDALRAWMVDAVSDDLDESASAGILEFNVADALMNLLVDVPVPPAVRAAAYRALADMPNVRSLGPMQDEVGRSGVGIEIGTSGDGAVHIIGAGGHIEADELTRTLVIDPDTSYVLAGEMSTGRSSAPFTDTHFLEVGWTDEEPQEPSLP